MKATSSHYIKEINDCMKQIKKGLKEFEMAEKIQEEKSYDWRQYDKVKRDAQDAVLSMMQALEEAVRLTSAIGCGVDLYEIYKYHKVVEFDFRDSHK